MGLGLSAGAGAAAGAGAGAVGTQQPLWQSRGPAPRACPLRLLPPDVGISLPSASLDRGPAGLGTPWVHQGLQGQGHLRGNASPEAGQDARAVARWRLWGHRQNEEQRGRETAHTLDLDMAFGGQRPEHTQREAELGQPTIADRGRQVNSAQVSSTLHANLAAGALGVEHVRRASSGHVYGVPGRGSDSVWGPEFCYRGVPSLAATEEGGASAPIPDAGRGLSVGGGKREGGRRHGGCRWTVHRGRSRRLRWGC